MVHHPYQEDLILKTKAKGEEFVHDQIKENVCTLNAAAKGCTKLQQSPDIKYQLFFVFEVRNASTETCLLPASIIFKHLQTIQVKDIEKQWKNMWRQVIPLSRPCKSHYNRTWLRCFA